MARAALIHVRRDNDRVDGDSSELDNWRLEIRAPIHGRVLRVFRESSDVVAPGTPLVELGDPSELEVVVDVLSSDAVRIVPGATVRLDEWGGAEPLDARVRHVEPSGFTKISALGVEEQRVNVIVDLVSPVELYRTLGDNFRVEARIIIDQASDALKVPNSAIFRHGDRPAVFVVQGGRAVLRPIVIARRGSAESEVVSGLDESERLVNYPSDKVVDGAAVKPRHPR